MHGGPRSRKEFRRFARSPITRRAKRYNSFSVALRAISFFLRVKVLTDWRPIEHSPEEVAVSPPGIALTVPFSTRTPGGTTKHGTRLSGRFRTAVHCLAVQRES